MFRTCSVDLLKWLMLVDMTLLQLLQNEEGLVAQVAELQHKKSRLQERVQGAQQGREGGVSPTTHNPEEM